MQPCDRPRLLPTCFRTWASTKRSLCWLPLPSPRSAWPSTFLGVRAQLRRRPQAAHALHRMPPAAWFRIGALQHPFALASCRPLCRRLLCYGMSAGVETEKKRAQLQLEVRPVGLCILCQHPAPAASKPATQLLVCPSSALSDTPQQPGSPLRCGCLTRVTRSASCCAAGAGEGAAGAAGRDPACD